MHSGASFVHLVYACPGDKRNNSLAISFVQEQKMLLKIFIMETQAGLQYQSQQSADPKHTLAGAGKQAKRPSCRRQCPDQQHYQLLSPQAGSHWTHKQLLPCHVPLKLSSAGTALPVWTMSGDACLSAIDPP